MKYFYSLSISILVSTISFLGCEQSSSTYPQEIVSSDIDNFWKAYDAVRSTTDSTEQYKSLEELFLTPASEGQKAMIEARNYTAESYIEAINSYPKFWDSIRENTSNAQEHSEELTAGVHLLREIYPELSHSEIYFTMGVFRSPGTGFDGRVLIGSEFALGDPTVDGSEFPESMSHIPAYHQTKPIGNIQQLNVHEYVHTQQAEMVHNLLSLTLYEGIAEFVAIKATEKDSPWPAFVFGPQNDELVRKQFEDEMFKPLSTRNWLWNSSENVFGVSEMGYYLGARIAEIHYNNSDDKQRAMKELIELDYSNEDEVEIFVNGTGYFSSGLSELYAAYESARPTVTGIRQFENGDTNVDPSIGQVTIEFSEPLSTVYMSTGLGELGLDHFPKTSDRTISDDGKSVTYHVNKMKAGHRYQILLENGYRTEDDRRLKPYLVDFTTKEN